MNEGEDPAIEVAPEELIPEAVNGNQKALRLLLVSAWLIGLLDDVSSWASRRFHVDAEDVWDFVFERVRRKIRTIKNPRNIPWPDYLTAWCYKVARRRGLNLLRHQGVKERHWDRVTHANTQSIRGGKRIAPLCSNAVSQEEEVEQHERDILEPKIHKAVRKIIDALKPEDATIISLWSKRQTLKKISEATGIPLATVDKRLKKIWQTLFEEISKLVGENIGEEQAEEFEITELPSKKEYRDGVRELILNSLLEAARGGHTTRPSV